jgi:hypothetical protein
METDTPPGETPESQDAKPWIRGLHMLILAVLFGVGQTLMCLAAILQFGWLLFTKRHNDNIATFGRDLAQWMQRVALFLTCATEDKPFPWSSHR